jgi:CYTH domain-containing protein
MQSAHDVDPAIADALGFPKRQYFVVERERRWLCRDFPRSSILQSFTVNDRYVDGARLRLREMRPLGDGPALLRLTRKADVDSRTRLITSIYLPEDEFAVLSAVLPGARLMKVRHRLEAPPGVVLSVDEFQGELAGLVLFEAEFQTNEERDAFEAPSFAAREVTEDARYCGGHLVRHGTPL